MLVINLNNAVNLSALVSTASSTNIPNIQIRRLTTDIEDASDSLGLDRAYALEIQKTMNGILEDA